MMSRKSSDGWNIDKEEIPLMNYQSHCQCVPYQNQNQNSFIAFVLTSKECAFVTLVHNIVH